jgi:peptidoglycan/xylan/chitin deacetylase (PgdA/CDA1 family)
LHDGSHRELGRNRAHSVEATDRLIRRYKAEGYEFVSIPEMMANGQMVQNAPRETTSAIR